MALNIPVNLMNTVATIAQPPVMAESGLAGPNAIAAVSGSSTSNPSAYGNDSTGRRGAEQQALLSKLRTTMKNPAQPDKAEPKSILEAKTAPPSAALTSPRPEPTGPHPSELDRYAPPNPLPTAPILLAATAYAARRTEG